MRPRTELALGLGALAVLSVLSTVLRKQQTPPPDTDTRRSTYLTGPLGARGLAEALERLGIVVRRFRQRTVHLEEMASRAGEPRRVLAVLDPTEAVDGAAAAALVRFSDSSDLLLAGPAAELAMRCFGFGVEDRFPDSVQAIPPGKPRGPATPWVYSVLAGSADSVVVDSTDKADLEIMTCAVPLRSTVDTLLVSTGGRVVALRVTLEKHGTHVTLVADGRLFSNRQLRDSDAGPAVLRMFAGRYDQVVFDEYVHGFGPAGSLARSAFAWSVHSPWGWGVWQLAVVGLLALVTGLNPLTGAIRFGPPRPPAGRRRRSPLEHVRALATVLAAARGQDVAVGAIVQGLRRRLAPTGRGAGAGWSATEWRAWLSRLSPSVKTDRGREAVRTLQRLSQPPQSTGSVLQAANAVEDVWEELRP